jgi:large subunit ribosomal protein L6
MDLRPEIDVEVNGNSAQVAIVGEEGERATRAYFGMTRALLQNMVAGVTKGFEEKLEIQGVGWNAASQGTKVVLNIGYNKPVTIEVPKGITVATPDPTNIIITGADKQAVGHLAASIRKRRPPEPYKGKGIRYKDEVVRRKAGKSFGS